MIGFVAPFQILDYLDRLKVVKETRSEYHCLCPVCSDGGFKIEKKSGKYQAFGMVQIRVTKQKDLEA